ncbi:MAG: energy transducer TonB [Flavobacteriales bacterium]|jgi:TonB family protein|nr:energy transducer TonB [Flavobacteriales bacterium]MBK6892923.1 energy transducer TonB [Flavobacteriales bacterium]MBK7247434.1 energy transducer TonB [Flavobacteriales bacterium]QQS72724.1 MAG: energy transducer TonB [Flavobacteriales bacterium]HQY79598.1 energy transducer TonB [Flavobacteriales bacterium]
MLNKKGPRFSALRYALGIPVVVASLLAVSCIQQDASPSSPPPPPPVPPIMDLSEVDVPPEFPGGMEAMHTFMQKSVHYPEQARDEKVQGKVYVQFTVDHDGKVKDVEIKRGMREDLNEEALRAMRAMPDWSPGSKDGQAVATRFIMPMEFRLDSTNSTGKD